MLNTNPIKAIFALIAFLTVCNLNTFATHLVGGEIYYEQIGTNNYLITLKVYRDCGPDNVNETDFDGQAFIGIYSGNLLVDVLEISIFDAIVTNVPITSENPCFILPPDLCIQEAIYSTTTNLPPTNIGYDIVYQRCCRNNSIVNILNADDSGMSIFAHIPGLTVTEEENSSPVFDNFPPIALCLNAEFWFDHAATDPDGDSLVYEFYTPFLGGGPNGFAPQDDPTNPQPNPPQPPDFDEVAWAGGYDVDYQLAASVDFEIDSETGFLTGTPNEIGRYAIGIAVHEYREGEYMNTTFRDFQYNVTLCDPNIVAGIPSQSQFCDGLTFQFTNESVNSTFFYWDFGDPDTTSDWSEEESPTYTYSEPGTYQVMLIANPTWPCADTSYATFEAYPLIEPGIVATDFECIGDVGFWDFEAEGNYIGDAIFSWDFGTNASPQTSSDENPDDIVFDNFGTQTVYLSITDWGCTEEIEIELEVPEPPEALIEDQELFCGGFSYDFANLSSSGDDFWWDFGDLSTLTDWSEDFEPSYTYPDSGTYIVTLTASTPFACPSSSSAELVIHTLLDPFFEPQSSQCFDGNSFDFMAEGTVDPFTIYEWDFGGNSDPLTSNLFNPQNVHYLETGTYDVTLTMEENGCVKSHTDIVEIIANPLIGFFQYNDSGCPPLNILFNDTSFAETTIYYDWDFGDGQSSNQPNPYHVYEYPGTYDVTLTIQTLTGCVQELTITHEDAVTVSPVPNAGFIATPPVVDILTPFVTVEDQSVGAIACNYFIQDQGSEQECNFDLTFNEAGIFEITQIVLNEFGCSDSVTKFITVEGFLFYIPNAFSPNDDGINDFFLTEGTGIQTFTMDIFDRWGTIIHSSQDMTEPWFGEVRGGNHYAINGTYTYHIIIQDLLGRPHEYVGHVNIVR